MKIADVMAHDVTTVSPETSLEDAAGALAERGISGLSVVAEDLRASFVERVPGVVAADSELTWREDDRNS